MSRKASAVGRRALGDLVNDRKPLEPGPQLPVLQRHAGAADAVRLGRRGRGSARPLYADLKIRVLTSRVIHTDDTVVPVLDHARPDTREGRLWVYVSDGRPAAIVYDYTADRSRAGPRAFLDAFHGYLQADAYAGYNALCATGRIVEVGCWAHARRYFFDAKASDPGRALPPRSKISEGLQHRNQHKVVNSTPHRSQVREKPG
jgi:hypothetical protein